MESGLTPREIQGRVRAGSSLDEVAEVAGMPRDRVERFALAVLDERRHLADQARTHSVRRPGETGSQRTLGAVVEEHFTRQGMDPDTITWDATRGEDRHFWTVTAAWQGDDTDHVATFGYDVRGTFSVAEDDLALALITSPTGEVPIADDEDDNEPTLNYADQFAIVNAVQSQPTAPSADTTDAGGDEADDEVDAETFDGPFDLHDIVPTPESELDALYAMLRGHQEDSVNIYAGLAESQPPAKSRRRRRRAERDAVEPPAEKASVEEIPEEAAETVEPPVETASAAADDEVDQPALVESDEPVAEKKPRKRPRKRAAVPSWDEIMFGGPDTDQ